MTLVFDTTVLSGILSNNDSLIREFSNQEYDRLIIPLATDAEIRYGFSYGMRQAENLKNYELFKKHFNIEIAYPDQDTSIIYSDLATWSRKHGVAISHNDLWIASTCIRFGGVLATLDKDFSKLPQIRISKINNSI